MPRRKWSTRSRYSATWLGDNRASYVIYDGSDLEFRRVDYDWMRTASKLAKLPIDEEEKRHLIERLETGV